jgi:hypothetical protein
MLYGFCFRSCLRVRFSMTLKNCEPSWHLLPQHSDLLCLSRYNGTMTCLVTSAFNVGLPKCSKSLNLWLCECSNMGITYPAKDQGIVEKPGDVESRGDETLVKSAKDKALVRKIDLYLMSSTCFLNLLAVSRLWCEFKH